MSSMDTVRERDAQDEEPGFRGSLPKFIELDDETELSAMFDSENVSERTRRHVSFPDS